MCNQQNRPWPETIVIIALLTAIASVGWCTFVRDSVRPKAIDINTVTEKVSTDMKVERRHGLRNFRNGIERGEKGLEAAQKAMPEFAEGMKHIDAAVQVFNDVFNGESPTAAPSTTTSQEIPIPVVEPATPPKAVVPPTIIDTPKDDAEDDASCSGGSCQNGQCQQYRSRRWGR